jgi:hydroxymethylbilane synthase
MSTPASRQVTEGRLDGVVLALAGLRRLGRDDQVTEILDPIQVLPAPGQGALAVEIRADDRTLREAVAALDDPDTRACVTAERSLLAALEAGCSAPVGALADVVIGDDRDELSLRGAVVAVDGSDEIRRSLTGPLDAPERLGAALAALLLEDGAGALVPDLAPPTSPTGGSTTRTTATPLGA